MAADTPTTTPTTTIVKTTDDDGSDASEALIMLADKLESILEGSLFEDEKTRMPAVLLAIGQISTHISNMESLVASLFESNLVIAAGIEEMRVRLSVLEEHSDESVEAGPLM